MNLLDYRRLRRTSMTEEQKQKIRQTHLRLAHGDNWTEEDQKNFERERNNRICRNYRKNHKEEFNGYQKTYQESFRKQNPYYYGWKQQNRNNPENKMTYEQYIAYRKQKEAKKEKNK